MTMMHDQNENETPVEQTAAQSTEPDYKDLFLRLNADMQNYKRRTERERISWMHEAQAQALTPIVPLLDEMERAVTQAQAHAGTHEAVWLQGFELLAKNFTKALQQIGVQEVRCQGDFDPELHEALIQVESTEHASGQVVQCLAKGYQLNNKVLRHAKVSVAK